MKGVQTQHRARGPGRHDVVDPLRTVGGDMGQRRGPLGSQVVEEPAQRVLVAVLARPHQPTRVMINHDKEIPLPRTAVMWVILVKGFRKDFLMNFCRVVDAQGDLAL